MNQTLFQIPVYFQSSESNLQRVRSEAKNFAMEQKNRQFPHPDSIDDLEQDYIRYETSPWKYNQIIGFIEVRYGGGGLKARYWWVDAKRTSPSMARKKFVDCGKLFDVSRNPMSKTNSEIRDDIRRFIDHLPKLRKRFEPRFFDTAHVEGVINFIDFGKLMKAKIAELEDQPINVVTRIDELVLTSKLAAFGIITLADISKASPAKIRELADAGILSVEAGEKLKKEAETFLKRQVE